MQESAGKERRFRQDPSESGDRNHRPRGGKRFSILKSVSIIFDNMVQELVNIYSFCYICELLIGK